jgi:glycosyltransferase involved in cell wall biosynthesis
LLRLGFDAKRAFHNQTGLGNYARTFLANLVRFYPEHEYHCFSPSVKELDGLTWFHNNPSSPRVHLHQDHSLLASWNRAFGMRNSLLANQIQLYHGLSNELPLDLQGHGSKIHTVVTVHDLIYRELPENYPPMDRWIYQFKTRRTLALADSIVAISQATRQQLLRYYPEYAPKIKVILQACSPIFYETTAEFRSDEALNPSSDATIAPSMHATPHPLGQQPFWLSVGTVEKRKNLETILHALYLMKPSERLPLVVIGRTGSPYATHCVHLARQWGLRVHWNPQLPSKGSLRSGVADLRSWYHHAVALIYPSHLEGFGLPVAEALLSHCPVITTRFSAMADLCGPHGLLVDAHSAEELQAAMVRLQGDASYRAQIQREGYLRARTILDPKLLTAQWIELYGEVLDLKPAASMSGENLVDGF